MNARSGLVHISRMIRHSVHKPMLRCITSAAQKGGKFETDISAFSSVSYGVTPLNSYGILKVTGKDSKSFLQGMVTNDITNCNDLSSTYNAILTPNGRYLYDCFISQWNDDYFIETESNMIPNLIKYLKKYKLRSKVKFEDISDEYRIWSILSAPKSIDSIYNDLRDNYMNKRLCYIDPRYNGLGIRLILNKNEIPHHISNDFQPIGEDFYYALKCIYGVGTHGIELIPEQTVILESNFNYLNGVVFNKGCYVGQELIARSHHQGQIRKRFFGASIIENDDINDINGTVKHIINHNSNRDTIFPTDIIDIESTKYDYKNRNIVDIGNKKRSGKIISEPHGLNCCIVQLRHNAFVDIESDDPKTVGLQIQDTNYSIIPHYIDYFTSFSELFLQND